MIEINRIETQSKINNIKRLKDESIDNDLIIKESKEYINYLEEKMKQIHDNNKKIMLDLINLTKKNKI